MFVFWYVNVNCDKTNFTVIVNHEIFFEIIIWTKIKHYFYLFFTLSDVSCMKDF